MDADASGKRVRARATDYFGITLRMFGDDGDGGGGGAGPGPGPGEANGTEGLTLAPITYESTNSHAVLYLMLCGHWVCLQA